MVADFRRPPQFVSKPRWQTVAKRHTSSVHPIPSQSSHPTQRMQRTSCFSATEVPLQTQPLHQQSRQKQFIFFHVFGFLTNFQICQLIDSNSFACEAKIHQRREERILAGQFLVLSWWRDASNILQCKEKRTAFFTEKPIGETASSVTEEESRRHILKFE